MRLTHIRMKNFKGYSGDYALRPLTMIVGPNYSGKSRIIEAITVALRGSLPKLGKTNPDTFRLSSGEVMAVLAEIDGQVGVRREWRRMPNGSIKAGMQSGVPVKFDDLPILDPSAYFAMSAAKRTGYLFSMTAPKGDCKEIKAVLDEVEANDPDFSGRDEEALNAMRDIFHEHCRTGSPNQAVVEIVERLKEEFTSWNRKEKEGAAANAKINALMERQPKRYAEYEALLDEMIECQDQQKALSKSIGAVPLVIPDDVKHPQPWRDSLLVTAEKYYDAVKSFEDQASRIDKVHSHDRCPYCLSSGLDWKKNILDYLRAERAQKEAEVRRLERQKEDEEQILVDVESKYDAALKLAEQTQREKRETLEAEMRKHEANTDDIARLVKDIEKWRTEEALLQKSVEQWRKAESFMKIIKACQARMDALKATWVDSVFVDFMARANRLGGDLLDAPLQFSDGEIGILKGTQFVTSETFSGSEHAICVTTIAAALANQFPMRLLLLDEMGVMTGKTQSRLLHRLRECVEANELDQVICVIPRDTPLNFQGWHVIETGCKPQS